MFLIALGLGIAYATSAQVSRSVPGGITVNIIPIQSLADIHGDGKVDHQDLMAVIGGLHTRPAGGATEDINHDRTVDVLDLAIVARYFGREVDE